jgi:hypothetical protein
MSLRADTLFDIFIEGLDVEWVEKEMIKIIGANKL